MGRERTLRLTGGFLFGVGSIAAMAALPVDAQDARRDAPPANEALERESRAVIDEAVRSRYELAPSDDSRIERLREAVAATPMFRATLEAPTPTSPDAATVPAFSAVFHDPSGELYIRPYDSDTIQTTTRVLIENTGISLTDQRVVVEMRVDLPNVDDDDLEFYRLALPYYDGAPLASAPAAGSSPPLNVREIFFTGSDAPNDFDNQTNIPSVIYGGDAGDILLGGTSIDWIYGGWGADVITGKAGDDRIRGMEDNDAIFAGAGDDYVDGGGGEDVLCGMAGEDDLIGGRDDDRLNGGADGDQDTLTGDGGADSYDIREDIDVVTDEANASLVTTTVMCSG